MYQEPVPFFSEKKPVDRVIYKVSANDKAGTNVCEDYLSWEVFPDKIVWRYHILDTPYLVERGSHVEADAIRRIKRSKDSYLNKEDFVFTSEIGAHIPVITFSMTVNLHTGKRKMKSERAIAELTERKSWFEADVELLTDDESEFRKVVELDPLLSQSMPRLSGAAKFVQDYFSRAVSVYVSSKLSEAGAPAVWRFEDSDRHITCRTQRSFNGHEGEAYIGAPVRIAGSYFNLANFADIQAGLPPRYMDVELFAGYSNELIKKRREKKAIDNKPEVMDIQKGMEMLKDLFTSGRSSYVYHLIMQDPGVAVDLFELHSGKHVPESPIKEKLLITKIRYYRINNSMALSQVSILGKDGQIYGTMPMKVLTESTWFTRAVAAQEFWRSYINDPEFKSYGWLVEPFEEVVARNKTQKHADWPSNVLKIKVENEGKG